MNLILKSTGLIILVFLMSCGNSTINNRNKEESQAGNKATNNITGNYVSDSYNQRNEGYDWISVSIKRNSADEIFLSVRSRADKMKPTCTFDTKAYKTNDSTYSAVSDGKNILFRFTSDSLEIETENPEDEAVLYFYCSGGATIAGTYAKIEGPLDSTQIDKTSFSKILRLQDVGFNVSSLPDGSLQKLEIYPFGLSLTNQTFTKIFEGKVMDAEIEDLNSDGFPEVLVYVESPDNKGSVIGISVINENTLRQIIFPDIENEPKVRLGYKGEDEFSIVETSLVRRFPLFENGEKTGKIRQIQYKMVVNGKTRSFNIKNVSEI